MSELEKLIQAEMKRIEEAQQAYQETETADQESSQTLNEADGAGNPTTLTEICKALQFKTDGMEEPNISEIRDSEWNNLFNAAKTKIGQVLASQTGSEATYRFSVKNFAQKAGLFKKTKLGDGFIMVTDPKLQSKKPPASLDINDLNKLDYGSINVTDKEEDAWLFDEPAAKRFQLEFTRKSLKGKLSDPIQANDKVEASETKVGDLRIPVVKAYIAAKLAGGAAQDNLPGPGSDADKIYTDMLKKFANAVINRNPQPLFDNVYIDGCINYFTKNGNTTQTNLLEYAAAAVQANAYDSRNLGRDDLGSTKLLMNAHFYTANTNAKQGAMILDAYKKLAERDRDRLIAKSIILLPADSTDVSGTLDEDVVKLLGGDNSVIDAVRSKFGGLDFETALVRNGQSAQDEMIKNIKDIAKAANKAPYGLVVNGTEHEAYKDTNQDDQWMTDEETPIKLKVGDQVRVTKSGTVIDGVRLTSNDRYSDVKIVNNKVDSFKDGATEGDCVIYFRVDEGHRSASCYITVASESDAEAETEGKAVVIEPVGTDVTIPTAIEGITDGKANPGTVIKFKPTFNTGFVYDSCDVSPASLSTSLAFNEASGELSFTMPGEPVNIKVKAKAAEEEVSATADGAEKFDDPKFAGKKLRLASSRSYLGKAESALDANKENATKLADIAKQLLATLYTSDAYMSLSSNLEDKWKVVAKVDKDGKITMLS